MNLSILKAELKVRAYELLGNQRVRIAVLVVFVGVILYFFVPGFSHAAALSFSRGETLHHTLSACITKEDAMEIANADADGGVGAAQVVWEKKDGCQTVPVIGYTVGKVVHVRSIVRDGMKLTMRVVEIIEGKEVVAYFLTSAPVSDHPFKSENNT